MIGFVGLSHLGIVSALAAAKKGFRVIGFDKNIDLVRSLRGNDFPITEAGLVELSHEVAERVEFTDSFERLRECKLVYLCLDVPTDECNQSDLEPLLTLFSEILSAVDKGATVVVLSQVPPGFMRELLSDELDISLYYQVETLIFGQAVERALYPERIIVGAANSSQSLPVEYSSFLSSFDCPLLVMGYESAELTKIAINVALVSSLSMTSMLAEVCENIGADWSEIEGALRLDRRIGPYAYLKPGLGLGGGNLERDLVTIKGVQKQHELSTDLVDNWVSLSEWRRDWVLRTLDQCVFSRLGQREEIKIAIWGLAYKAGTHSTKNSPTLGLLPTLSQSSVSLHDPQAGLDEPLDFVTQVGDPLVACGGADALIIMTPWPEYRTVDVGRIASTLRGRVLIDPYRLFSVAQARANGLEYYTLGLKAGAV